MDPGELTDLIVRLNTSQLRRSKRGALIVMLALGVGSFGANAAAFPARSAQEQPASNNELQKAAELMRSGNLLEAESVVRSILKSDTRNAAAHTLLVVILFQRGIPAEAETELRRALKYDPKFVAALTNLGVLLSGTKRLDEAIAAFEAALRLAPEHREAQYNLAVLYGQTRKFDQAVMLLNRLVDSSGGRASADVTVLLALVNAYVGANQLRNALEIAELIERRSANDPRVLFTLGLSLADAEQIGRAH